MSLSTIEVWSRDVETVLGHSAAEVVDGQGDLVRIGLFVLLVLLLADLLCAGLLLTEHQLSGAGLAVVGVMDGDGGADTGILVGVGRNVANELLGCQREEALDADIGALEAVLGQVVVDHSVGDDRGVVSHEVEKLVDGLVLAGELGDLEELSVLGVCAGAVLWGLRAKQHSVIDRGLLPVVELVELVVDIQVLIDGDLLLAHATPGGWRYVGADSRARQTRVI